MSEFEHFVGLAPKELRKRVNVKLIVNEDSLGKWRLVIAVQQKFKILLLNKPIYVGFSELLSLGRIK